MEKYILLLGLLFPISIIACSCIGPNNFCKSLSFSEIDYSILIGKKSGDQNGTSVDFHIEEKIHGINDFPDKIRLKNGFGADCIVSTGNWDESISYIILLAETNEDDFYSLSICGINFLEYDGNLVKGYIDMGEYQEMSYSSFLEALDCLGEPLNISSFSILQNPVSDNISL
jgi:hypothetical protein